MFQKAHATEADGSLGEAPLELLSPFERTSFRVIDFLVRRARPITEVYNRSVTIGYITLGGGRLMTVRGLERLRRLRPEDGILLVANHRSFFDLYMLTAAMHRDTPLHQPVICPVRADFFYERPLGLLVNLLASAGRMYPPFFRDSKKLAFNRWSIARAAELLRGGHVVLGFHPEGTRNKNVDPYVPLPAQPGIGKLIMETWPIVVPAFILGMSSNILAEIKANYTGAHNKVVAVFGEPIDLTPFRSMGDRLASHKRIADHLLKVIYALGEEERAIRREMALP